MKPLPYCCLFIATAASLPAATIIDDFESGNFSGGSGWSGGWTTGGSGSFSNGASQINGVRSGALFGTSSLARNFTAIATGTVTATWSLKGLPAFGNFNELGLNIRGLKSDSATNVLTMKFTDLASTSVTLNDGGTDFNQGTLGYKANAIYDFSFTSTVGGNTYSWSVNERGTANTTSGNAFTYSGGSTLTNVNGLTFFWSANSGGGNDGLIDQVSVIPEPSAAILGAIGSLILLRRRR